MERKELAVVVKAQDLIEHTFLLTNNQNRFPKKTRYTLVQRLQDKVLHLYECLVSANECDVRFSAMQQKRRDLQIEAITDCKVMLYLIELSMKLHYINANSCAYWSKLVCDVKNMTAAWLKADARK
jgi:hypothetical protein